MTHTQLFRGKYIIWFHDKWNDEFLQVGWMTRFSTEEQILKMTKKCGSQTEVQPLEDTKVERSPRDVVEAQGRVTCRCLHLLQSSPDHK